MFSIGDISKQVGVKIPTIRYYEKLGLVAEPSRTAGNQRRYSQTDLKRLEFIKHARKLGFTLEAISSLIKLSGLSSEDCQAIDEVAKSHLVEVRSKLNLLLRLEAELVRITTGCSQGDIARCYVIESLTRHDLCLDDHERVVTLNLGE